MSVTLHELLVALYSEEGLGWVGDIDPSWLFERLSEITLASRGSYQARYNIANTAI